MTGAPGAGARLFLSGVMRGRGLHRQRIGGRWYARDLRARWVGPDDAEHVSRPDDETDDPVIGALADVDDVPAGVERLVARGIVPADALDPGAPRRWDATTTIDGRSIAGCGRGRARITVGGVERVAEADLSDPSAEVAAALAAEAALPSGSPWADDRWFARSEIARRTLDAERAALGSWPMPPTVAHLAAWARFGAQRIADAEALAREYAGVAVVRWRMVGATSMFLRHPDAAAIAAARARPDVVERLRALGVERVERERGRVTLTLVADGV